MVKSNCLGKVIILESRVIGESFRDCYWLRSVVDMTWGIPSCMVLQPASRKGPNELRIRACMFSHLSLAQLRCFAVALQSSACFLWLPVLSSTVVPWVVSRTSLLCEVKLSLRFRCICIFICIFICIYIYIFTRVINTELGHCQYSSLKLLFLQCLSASGLRFASKPPCFKTSMSRVSIPGTRRKSCYDQWWLITGWS